MFYIYALNTMYICSCTCGFAGHTHAVVFPRLVELSVPLLHLIMLFFAFFPSKDKDKSCAEKGHCALRNTALSFEKVQ